MNPSHFQAMVFAAPRRAEPATCPSAAPEAGQLRVRLQGCGVCASNLPVWEGREWFDYPLAAGAPGHEGWGLIEAVGPEVHDFEVGQRVAFVSGHAYAEVDLASAIATVPLPPELDGLPFPGEPLGCALNIFERSDIRPGHRVAVVGADVLAISRREFSLGLARRHGARSVLRVAGETAARALQLAGGCGYERVIETGGEQATLDLASALVAERGRLVIAGYHQDGDRRVDLQSWNWRGIDVINAHERAPQRYADGMRAAIEAVLHGGLDPFGLFTHRLPLARLDAALDLARSRPEGFVKALVECDA